MDYLGFQWITFQMLFTNCTTCVQDIGDKQEVSKSNNNNNNNKMTETTTRTKKKKTEEEEEYGGVKVLLHECKFEVGNQLLNLKEKNTEIQWMLIIRELSRSIKLNIRKRLTTETDWRWRWYSVVESTTWNTNKCTKEKSTHIKTERIPKYAMIVASNQVWSTILTDRLIANLIYTQICWIDELSDIMEVWKYCSVLWEIKWISDL